MTNTPPLNRFLFIVFFLVALIVESGALLSPDIRALSYAPVRDILFPNFYLNSRASMPVRLKIAVPPSLEKWVTASGADFTAENSLYTVEVIPLRGGEANRELNNVSGLPDAWIAEAEFVRLAAGGIPYENAGMPLAQDSLFWVGESSLPANSLSWTAISEAASADPQFRVALPPLGSVEGMAACYSAAAEFHHQETITADKVNDPEFQSWLLRLRESASDLQRNPRDAMASRPPQATAGLILLSDWSTIGGNGLLSQKTAYGISFSFPYYLRSSWQEYSVEEAAARQDAAVRFRSFLLGSKSQNRLAEFGLGRAPNGKSGEVSLDEQTTQALRFCWSG